MRYIIVLLFCMVSAYAVAAQEACPTRWDDAFTGFIHEAALRAGRREYDRALDAYNCALALQPNSAIALNGRGNVYLNSGENELALADFEALVALAPQNPLGHHNRGFALYNLGRYQDAIAAFDRAIALDPEYAFAYNSRGLAYFRSQNMEAAIADFEKAIELEIQPAFYPYQNLGLLYLEQENYPDARRWLTEAVRVAPDNPTHHLWLGDALYHLGLLDEALQHYQTYRQLTPDIIPEDVAQRIRSLETRDSFIRFLPTLAIVVLGAYWLFLRWLQRRRQPTPEPAPISQSVAPTLAPIADAPSPPRRWLRGILAIPIVALLALGVGRLFRQN